MNPFFENYFIAVKPKAPHPKGKNIAPRNAQIGKVLIKAIQSKPVLNVFFHRKHSLEVGAGRSSRRLEH